MFDPVSRVALSTVRIQYLSTYNLNNFYRLSDGVEMSSPVSWVVANIFMEDLEQKVVTTAEELGPRMLGRYEDVVFLFC